MPSGLSQSHQEIAGQFQRELLQLICLGSGGQHVQRPLPRGMGRPIGLQCPCNSFTRQEVRGASDSTNQRIENNALVSSSGFTGGARRVVYLVVSYSPVRTAAGKENGAPDAHGGEYGNQLKKEANPTPPRGIQRRSAIKKIYICMMAWRVRAAIIEGRMWALGSSRSPKRARRTNWERAQQRQSEHFSGSGRGGYACRQNSWAFG